MRVTVIVLALLAANWGIVTYFSHTTYPDQVKREAEGLIVMAETDQREELEACLRGGDVDGFTLPTMTLKECVRQWHSEMQTRFPDLFRFGSIMDLIVRLSPGLFLLSWMLGAALVGADMSNGIVFTSLQWQPRRSLFLGSKLLGLVIVTTVGVVVLYLVIGLTALPSGLWRGTFVGIDGQWWRLLADSISKAAMMAGIGVIIGSCTAVIGRGTAAGLLALAVYYVSGVVAEMTGREYPLKIIEGVEWFVGGSTGVGGTYTELESGLLLGGLGGIVLLIGWLLFVFRDV